MTAGDYVAGATALVLTVVPWVLAAPRLQRRILPSWSGADAALVATVIGTAGVLLVAEVLGAVHEFGRWRLAVASLVLAAVVARFGRGSAEATERRDAGWPAGRAGYLGAACTVVAVVAVAAALAGAVATSLHTGPLAGDSLHYHLTQAAYFVQSHSIDGFHQTGSSDVTPYYPFNAELLDAVLMQGPRPDLATLPLNLGWAAMLLLACWVIGRRWSEGSLAVIAGCLFLAAPITRAGAGPGLNDLPGVAFLLAAVAVLVRAGVPRGDASRPEWTAAMAVAGVALGLAAGTKISLLGPAVLTALAVLVVARGDRLRAGVALAVGGAVTGGFWYVRDWIHTGSPVPETTLTVAGHGWHAIPTPEVAPYDFSVAHYLTDGSIVRHWFAPGLRAAFGVAWLVVALLCVVGLIAAVVQRQRFRALLAVVTTLSFGLYLVTPTTALGLPGAPTLFAVNTRYALPVVALALVLAVSAATSSRLRTWLKVAMVALTVIALAHAGPIVPATRVAVGIAAALIGALTVALLVVAPARHRAAVAVTVTVVAAVVIGAVVQPRYRDARYDESAGVRSQLYQAVAHDPARHRVGVVGLAHEYPFYGPTFANPVNYVGVTDRDGAFGAPRSCRGLMAVLAAQHDDLLVVEPLAQEHTAQIEHWVESIHGVRVVVRNPQGVVYALPAISPTLCR